MSKSSLLLVHKNCMGFGKEIAAGLPSVAFLFELTKVATLTVSSSSVLPKVQTDISGSTMRKVTGVIVGAGKRGKNYSQYALHSQEEFEIIGVAEPRDHARNWMKNKFNLPDGRCFLGWESLSKVEKLADCVVICTQDQDHINAVVALADIGYHILVEKPMAITAEDCKKIYSSCKKNNVILAVCHVLRYHPSVIKLKQLIDAGVIGDVVNINHVEPVGHWHFAHSFVRGDWGNSSRSTFSLLSKCCHDVDLINYWMSGTKCTKISSFGSLQHFKSANKPPGAGKRCLDCKVEETCAYSAKKIYLDPKPRGPTWPMSAVWDIEEPPELYLKNLTKAIKSGPYGRCVYDTDNDVCDNQIVNFQFENGSSASLTMIAFSKEICARQTTISGSKGVLKWNDFQGYSIDHFDFLTERSAIIECQERNPGKNWGHAGSDYFTIKTFVDAVATNDPSKIRTCPKESLASHLLTFAAEESRLSGKIINLEEDTKWRVVD